MDDGDTYEYDQEHEEVIAELARVLSVDGQGEVTSVSNEVWSEMQSLFARGVGDALHDHYAAVGELVSMAASLEHEVESLAAFLLNPSEPGRAAPALKPLTAAKARELAAALLVPRWPDMSRLILELERIASARNRFAHNALTPFTISDDGQSLDKEVTIAYKRWSKHRVEEVRESAPLTVIQDWAARARLASTLISKAMFTLLVWERSDSKEPLAVPIDFLVYGTPESPVSEDDAGFTTEERERFQRVYGGK